MSWALSVAAKRSMKERAAPPSYATAAAANVVPARAAPAISDLRCIGILPLIRLAFFEMKEVPVSGGRDFRWVGMTPFLRRRLQIRRK